MPFIIFKVISDNKPVPSENTETIYQYSCDTEATQETQSLTQLEKILHEINDGELISFRGILKLDNDSKEKRFKSRVYRIIHENDYLFFDYLHTGETTCDDMYIKHRVDIIQMLNPEFKPVEFKTNVSISNPESKLLELRNVITSLTDNDRKTDSLEFQITLHSSNFTNSFNSALQLNEHLTHLFNGEVVAFQCYSYYINNEEHYRASLKFYRICKNNDALLFEYIPCLEEDMEYNTSITIKQITIPNDEDNKKYSYLKPILSNRNYVDLDSMELYNTGLKVNLNDCDNTYYSVYYEAFSKNCYLSQFNFSKMRHYNLTPFISPNGTPYKYDEECKKIYY